MRVAFSVATPHQVHVFRNAAHRLMDKGETVTFIARDYGCTLSLLDHYRLPYIVHYKTYKSFAGKLLELARSELVGTDAIRRFDADLVVGDPLLGIPSKLCGIPSICFVDGDNSDFFALQYRTLYRSDIICTPDGFRLSIDHRQLRYPGYQELAYLHPRWYKPDDSVLKRIGAGDASYSLVRFSAFDSRSHDVRYKQIGWNERRRLVSRLSEVGRVYISSEAPLPQDLAPLRLDISPHEIHDVMKHASVVVTETAMCVEAALLGTPSIFIHPSVGLNCASNFLDMEKYGLQRNYSSYDLGAKKAVETVQTKSKVECASILHKLLMEKIDVTMFVLWLIDQVMDGSSSAIGSRPDFRQFIASEDS